MAEAYPHIIFPQPPETTSFTSTSSRGKKNIPTDRIRQIHSASLKQKLEKAWTDTTSEQIVHYATRKGVYLEFKGEAGFDLVTKSLEDMRSKKFGF